MADSTVSIGAGLQAYAWDSATPETYSAEAELIEGLRQGNDAAYERLLAAYERPIYRLVYRLLAAPEDASDVVQEVFFKVFRSIGSFRAQCSLRTWIYRIAVNEANNHRRWFWRKRGKETGLETDMGDGLKVEQTLEDPGRSPFEAVHSAEVLSIVEQGLQELKPLFREAVVLRDIEEFSYEEIADILHVSLGTVKSRILRGREALRLQVEAKMQAPTPGWRMQTAGEGSRI
jgi:RNA polymerase sigma-70 factor, ECF subfamily